MTTGEGPTSTARDSNEVAWYLPTPLTGNKEEILELGMISITKVCHFICLINDETQIQWLR